MFLPLLSQTPILPVTPAMLVDENGVGGAEALVDEPGVAKPSKPFFPGWKADRYPVSVAIDLGGLCQIDKVAIYHESGEGAAEVSTGRPFAWKTAPVKLSGYQNWIDAPVGVETRWLRLTLKGVSSFPEIVVYGRRLAPVPPPKRPIRGPLPTMDRLIGVNAFIDDPIDRIAPPGGLVREYHTWGWDVEGPDRLVRFQPSGAAGGAAWFFDDYYAKLKAAGCEVAPCLQQAPVWLFDAKSGENKPLAPGSDPTTPASYRKHAEHLFQYAARYGSRKVADAELTLAPGQPRRSGMGLLRWLENWNEPDKTWWGRDPRFDPYELAAMSSADYDGHRGALGKGVGAKTADPTIRLAMGGLAGLNLDYLKAMKLWADHHRGGSFPADALNLHHYSSTAGEQGFQPDTKALSPEADHLKEKMQAIVDWRDANLPGKEVWLTEFGYDTNQGSPIYSAPIGSMSAQEVQAAWLVRGYLALAAARVDRAAMFMLRDVDSKSTGVFGTCGLVEEKGSWKPKPSFFYVSALRHNLTGMRFGAEVPTGRADVKVYRFDGPKSRAYAVWCPTSEDKHVAGFRLKLPARAARRVTFEPGKLNGVSRPLASKAGAFEIDVSETPILVIEDRR